MRRLILSLSLLLALPAAGLADPASDPILAPRAVVDELRAIARVRSARDTSGGCSAVLVAPTLALTAAHCAPSETQPTMNPLMVIFGPDMAPPLFRIRVLAASHHVDYGREERSINTIYSDLALLHLEAPVPADVARPIPLATPPEGLQVSIFGYLNGRFDLLHGHPACALGTVRPGLLGSDCTVLSGFSGTGVLSGPRGERRLEGIAVARLFEPTLRALIADVVPWPSFNDGTPAPQTPPSAP